jgi:hypothetical protein
MWEIMRGEGASRLEKRIESKQKIKEEKRRRSSKRHKVKKPKGIDRIPGKIRTNRTLIVAAQPARCGSAEGHAM